MIAAIAAELAAYLRRHPDDAARLQRLRAQVADADPAIAARGNMRGHVTASVLALDAGRRNLLLIHHRAFDRWMQPGGHHEESPTLYASALRELAEETGLSGTAPFGGAPCLLDVDTHAIAARPAKGEGAHWHHDFLYLECCAGPFIPVPQLEEVSGVRWFPVTRMAELGPRFARLGDRLAALQAAA